VTPLRVWQLSQLALSGMMAGLLTQPRRRVGPEALDRPRGEMPAALKRRLVDLEKKLARTENLVRVLSGWPRGRRRTRSRPRKAERRVACEQPSQVQQEGRVEDGYRPSAAARLDGREHADRSGPHRLSTMRLDSRYWIGRPTRSRTPAAAWRMVLVVLST
jgi:hypothetical protein